MNIFIIGLRRSGTTIFWEMFRQDARFVCYDEPYNPMLDELPEEHDKMVRAEFITLYNRDPEDFKRRFAPIPVEEEMHGGMTQAQKDYLKHLIGTAEHTVMDFTRVHFKLRDLHEIDPGAVLVHLYRRPQSSATSHLLPSGGKTLRRKISTWMRLRTFWTRYRWYNNYSFENMIDNCSRGRFDELVRQTGLDVAKVRAMPAIGKLLVWWRVAYETAEKDGRSLYGDRFVSLSFEEFCQQPEKVLRNIYDKAGIEFKGMDLRKVHPAKPPHEADNRKWAYWLEQTGLSQWHRDGGHA
ncbi:MAG: hypothetical protein GC164_16235 [Phycisphaera sp.]|nr:hypothetical protein [Phycisphaera sp.]